MPLPKPVLILFAHALTASAQTMERRWTQQYNGPANLTDAGRAVVVDSQGAVVVSAISQPLSYINDFYTLNYAAEDGALVWDRRETPNNGLSSPEALALDPWDNVIVAGSVEPPANPRYYVVKYAARSGARLWEKFIAGGTPTGTTRYRYAADVKTDSAGNIIVTGTISTASDANYDLSLIHI